jgi:hypothetical protein
MTVFSRICSARSGVFTPPVSFILIASHGDERNICALSRLGLVLSGSNADQRRMIREQVATAVRDTLGAVLSRWNGGADPGTVTD